MIRLLTLLDYEIYRTIRLASLKSDPLSFLSTYQDESIKPNNYFQQKISYSIKQPFWGFWGYFDGNELVAYLQIADGYFSKKRHIAYIYEVYVLPKKRRKNFATLLVKSILQKLNTHPEIEILELKVNSKNTIAIAFYEKLGFKKIATLPLAVKEPDGSYQDEYIFDYQFDRK